MHQLGCLKNFDGAPRLKNARTVGDLQFGDQVTAHGVVHTIGDVVRSGGDVGIVAAGVCMGTEFFLVVDLLQKSSVVSKYYCVVARDPHARATWPVRNVAKVAAWYHAVDDCFVVVF